MIAGHDCNVFCTADEHCDLVYSSTADAGQIAQAYAWTEGVVVTRTEPAREAPPAETMPRENRRGLTANGWLAISDAHRLLVWWRIS